LLTILLAPYDDMGAFSGRVSVSVLTTSVGVSTANPLGLVIHELATNSLKYRALSRRRQGGTVHRHRLRHGAASAHV
jgi:two-component sensor histidine kinase